MKPRLFLARSPWGRILLHRIYTGLLLAAALVAGPLLRQAQADPPITLAYYGNIEGVFSAVVLQFEDDRLPGGYPFGFYYSFDGRLCWQRVAPLDGRIYVSGYTASPFDLNTPYEHLSDCTINGTSDWGYLSIVPRGDSSFQGRIDFPSDDNLVYMDALALTANPLGPGAPTTSYLYLDVVSTPTISPNGGNFSAAVEVTLACPTTGATIYYTTDGTTPTFNSAVYRAPFTLNASATVKAKGVSFGSTDSSVASATFTVTTSAPSLTITRSDDGVIVSWPLSAQGYMLESAGTLTGTDQWSVVPGTPTTNGLFLQMVDPVSDAAKFFRLKK